MNINNTGLRALTTSKERQEIRAVGRIPVKLRYRGRMAWMVKAGHDGRIWDLLGSNNEYATLTLDGLKEMKII